MRDSDEQEDIQEFQVFVKPGSYHCNLQCSYCYYLAVGKCLNTWFPGHMGDDVLKRYLSSHIDACDGKHIHFSWHGGEPTLLGIEYFNNIVELQNDLCPPGKQIHNAIQTNGTLIDDRWATFLARHGFIVGVSLDGPPELHNAYRKTIQGETTFDQAYRGYRLLIAHNVPVDVLCVVNDCNVLYPMQIYRFFKEIGVRHLSFLPLVEQQANGTTIVVSERSVPAEAFGAFLCVIFDEWKAGDIGRIKVQIFEEVLRTAFEQQHSLCLFRPECGDIPVLEANGDVYACDHYVHPSYRIGNITKSSLADILNSEKLQQFGKAKKKHLPTLCKKCEVLAMCNGECPKNRFVQVEGGESGTMNYLCSGYRLFFNHCRPFVDAVAEQWRKELMLPESK